MLIEYTKIRYQIYKGMIIGFYQVKKTMKDQGKARTKIYSIFLEDNIILDQSYVLKLCIKIKASGHFYKKKLVINRPLI